MIIIVTGTPGTGKTTLAKKVAKKLKHRYLDVKSLIEKKRLSVKYDKERDCLVIDEKRLTKELVSNIRKNKNMVIDSHLSHYLPPKYVGMCIVTTCNLKTLERRLKKRKYSKEKIRENLDSEIFDTCHVEAKEKGHACIIVDTT